MSELFDLEFWSKPMRQIAALFSLKSLVSAALVSVAVLSLSGCNTVQGMGRDIERGGQAIEKAAK
jgi:predicted small secreted protein